MYLFLYQNETRHRRSYYNRSRAAKDSTYNQFNLAQLRKAMKDKFTIYGYGTHPAQKALGDMDLENLMKGHIIAVEDPKLAVWMKLNYDQVCKNKTTYIGCYTDIDHEYIAGLSEQKNEFDSIASVTSNQSYWANTLQYQIEAYLTRLETVETVTGVDKTLKKASQQLVAQKEIFDKTAEDSREGSKRAIEEVSKYIKSRMIGKVGT